MSHTVTGGSENDGKYRPLTFNDSISEIQDGSNAHGQISYELREATKWTSTSARMSGHISTDHTCNDNSRPGRLTKIYQKYVLRSGKMQQYRSVEDDESTRPGVNKWRLGVLCSVAGLFGCFVLEIVLAVLAFNSSTVSGGFGSLYEGSCAEVQKTNTLLLIPLNVVATVITSSSNYFTQLLVAPTRKEVDRAHANGLPLQIGNTGLRNFRHLASWKSFTLLLFWCSSIPVHLLINSVVTPSLSANNYGVVIMDNSVFTNYSDSVCRQVVSQYHSIGYQWICDVPNGVVNGTKNYTRLGREDCIRAYGDNLQSRYGNVLLVTRSENRWSSLDITPDWNSTDYSYMDLVLNGWSTSILNNTTTIAYAPMSGNAELRWEGRSKLNCMSEKCSDSGGYHTIRGSFITANDPFWNVTQMRSLFTAWDYNFWSNAQNVFYDHTNPLFQRGTVWGPNSWICSLNPPLTPSTCDTETALSQISTGWRVTPAQIPIEECWAQQTEEMCTLRYSLAIIVVILVCGLIKMVSAVIVLTTTLRKSHADPEMEPLITVGDAVDSFLTRPDETSVDRCLVDLHRTAKLRNVAVPNALRVGEWYQLTLQQRIENNSDRFGPHTLAWEAKPLRWSKIPSRTRWRWFLCFYILLVALTVSFAIVAYVKTRQVGVRMISSFFKLDLNTIFTGALWEGTTASNFLNQSIVLNLPQLGFTLLYYQLNGILTSMSVAREWSRFSPTQQKGASLRVSNPRGIQRSTYWLNLPLRYSIPAILGSIALHFLVSRALFLVKIDVYGYNNQPEFINDYNNRMNRNGFRNVNYIYKDTSRSISAVGYSWVAGALVLILLILIGFVLLSLCRKRVDPNIPQVGNNSWAISAMCHDMRDDKDVYHDTAKHVLQWGVTKEATDSKPGHCTLTDRKISMPIEGRLYT